MEKHVGLKIKNLRKQNKEQANELINDDVAVSVDDHESSIKQLQSELKKIEKRREKWQYAWADDEMSYTDYKKRMAEENEKEKMIQKELNELTPKESSTADSSIIDLWTDLKLNWEHMDDQAKKQFILIAVNYIIVDKINKNRTPDSIEIIDVKFN